MFKIVELPDGSTKVYDNETGRIICSVPKKRDKPLAVISPFSGTSSDMNIRSSENGRLEGIGRPMRRQVDLSPRNHGFQLQDSLQCAVMPIQWESSFNHKLVANQCSFRPEHDLSLDQEISEDCISQQDFLHTLNLCPAKATQKKDDWMLLKTKLPTRFINQIDRKLISKAKVGEDIDLTCQIGRLHLSNDKENERSKTINEMAKEDCVKKYEEFCKVKNDNPLPYVMRHREFRDYTNSLHRPVKPMTEYHKYSFTKKERRERLRVIETGLDKESRKLYRLCQKTKFSVRLKRLAPSTIHKWTAKKAKEIIFIDLEPSPPPKSKKNSPQRQEKCENGRKYTMKQCEIKLRDITKDFEFRLDGSAYLRGTDLKVTYPNNISPFHTYAKQYPVVPALNHQDHAYYSKKEKPKPVVKSKIFSPHSRVKVPSSLKIIPIIDITSDDDEVMEEHPPISAETNFIPPDIVQALFLSPNIIGPPIVGLFTFRCLCHPCKYLKSCTVQDQASSIIRNHMNLVHTSRSSDWGLTVKKNKDENIFIIEAFWNYRFN